MNKTISKHAQEASNSSRPSLYGAAKETTENPAAFSILKGIEPQRQRPRVRLHMAWAAPLMALAAVVLVAALNNGFDQLASFETPSIPDSIKETRKDAAPAATPPVATSGTAEPALQPAVEPAVATIISEENKTGALTGAMAAADSGETTEIPAQEPRQTTVQTTEVVAVTAAAALAAPKIDSATTPANAQTQREEQGKLSASRERPAARRDDAAVADARGAESKKKTGKDKDVDLIAALLTHVSSGSKAPVSEAQKKATSNSPTVQRSSLGTGSKREQKTSANRDVVTAAPGESTESLVKRCKALGFFEGELCRLRICSGMWGKDAACPSNTPHQVD